MSLIILIIVIALILGLYFLLKSRGFALFSLSQSIINQLDNEKDGSCSLVISPSQINLGDSVTGTIKADSDTDCITFAKQQGTSDWKIIYEGTTDSSGELSDTAFINIEGTFDFRAICKSCVTNRDTLIVTSSCTETDSGNDKDTPGITTVSGVSYMDLCLPVGQAVTEYYCSGDALAHDNIACDLGQICVDTRSGGYCEDAPTYNNGDLVGSDSGSGSTSNTDNVFEINLGDLGVGNCQLEATISTSWDYGNEFCQGLQGMEGVKWDFYDSNSLEYSRIDAVPVGLGVVTRCGLEYDGTPFRLEMSKTMGLPDCLIDYEWEVRIVACDCQ